MQAIMLNSKPFETKLDNRMNLIIELAVSLYLYTYLSLTEFMGPHSLSDHLGWVLAILISSTIALTLLVFLCTSTLTLYEKLKNFILKKRKASAESVIAI